MVYKTGDTSNAHKRPIHESGGDKMQAISNRIVPVVLATGLWLIGNSLLSVQKARGDELFSLLNECQAWHTSHFVTDCTTGSSCIVRNTAEAHCVPSVNGILNCHTVLDLSRPAQLYFSSCPCGPYDPNAPSNPGYINTGPTTAPGQKCP